MRWPIVLSIALLAACGGEAEPPPASEPEAHFLTEQEKALQKAKETKAALEAAARRTQDIVDETIDQP